jgi:RNA polymerase primary sigma factor
LSQHIRAKDQHAESAIQRLVEAHLHLVVSIAERYRSKGIHILDLIQRGNDGLLNAVRTFSDNSRDDWPAHATPYIERAIAKAIPH